MRKPNRDLGIFTYNGKSSKDFDIIVEKLPSLSRPERQYSVYKVPGRNGDIIEQYDAYNNINMCFIIHYYHTNCLMITFI
jgi:phage-related protein